MHYKGCFHQERSMTEVTIQLRTITEADLPALFDIYASTRAEELALVPDWTEEHKAAFLTQQFLAQHQYYQEFYKKAEFYIIEYNNQAIGRFYIHWNYSAQEVRIVDIALLPDFRSKGIGTYFIKDTFQKAAALHKSVTIHVEYNNPALKLYERLGFCKIGEFNSVYYLMEWKGDRGTE